MAHIADKVQIIQVKERLDHLRLPSNFAIQDLPLISKLLTRLQECQDEIKKVDQTQEHSRELSQADEALTIEVTRLVRENGQLRRELWAAREAAEELKMAISDKMDTKLEKETKQLDHIKILEEKNRREAQLFGELEQIRYKYNELMELIHENPTFERQYIKRLLKFKKAENTQPQPLLQPNTYSKITQSLPNSSTSSEISLLKGKLLAREEEILRLQKIAQQNHSYIQYRHLQHKQSQKEMLLSEEIAHLSQQNQSLRKKLAAIPHYHQLTSPHKKEKSNSSKNDIVLNKYVQQFEETTEEDSSSILEQRYNNSKEKETIKDRRTSNVKTNAVIKKATIIQQPANEYYHHSQINHKNKPKQLRYQSPTNQNQLIKQQHPCQDKNHTSSKKPQKKPITIASPKHANISHPIPKKNEETNTKQNKQAQHTVSYETSLKPPKSPPHQKAHTKEDQNLISTYQRLLQQKDLRIRQLEKEVKSLPSHSTKITSTQNINTNNSPSKNVIIKTNRKEYININNITPNPTDREQRDSFMENEMAQANRDRERLSERVESLEREREIQKERERSRRKVEEQQNDGTKGRMEQSKLIQVNQLENLQQKLIQTQKSLLMTNEKNAALQKQINQLLVQAKSHKCQTNLNIIQSEDPSKEQQWRGQVITLESEIKKLKTQILQLHNDREILLSRLRELEAALHKQTLQMRTFERRICYGDRSQDSSLVSEIVQLQNQSEIDHPR